MPQYHPTLSARIPTIPQTLSGLHHVHRAQVVHQRRVGLCGGDSLEAGVGIEGDRLVHEGALNPAQLVCSHVNRSVHTKAYISACGGALLCHIVGGGEGKGV